MKRAIEIETAEAMRALGARLAYYLPPRGIVTLEGELGSGKTTLVRGLLHELGWSGIVRSPTYSLVEGYQLGVRHLCHVDLYRLSTREEVEQLGLQDYLQGDTLLLIEWPQRAPGAWKNSILQLHIIGHDDASVPPHADEDWHDDTPREVNFSGPLSDYVMAAEVLHRGKPNRYG